jgi:hypothetical protein
MMEGNDLTYLQSALLGFWHEEEDHRERQHI